MSVRDVELHRRSPDAILRSVFKGDDEAAIAAVEDTVFLELLAGAVPFAQGDTGDEVYFVLNGRLRAVVHADLCITPTPARMSGRASERKHR